MAVNTELSEKPDTVQQFEALFNYATIGIVATDQNGQIINFNKCAETQFGYTKAEILGKLVEILIPDTYRTDHVKQRNHYHQHPEPRSMGAGRDLYAKRKDGSVFPVEVSLSHYVHNGQTFVIAFVVDITVRKQSELVVVAQKQELEKITSQVMELNVALEQRVEDRTKQLRDTMAALEQSKAELSEALKSERKLSEMKSNFVTLASHEFRTPLSTILSSAYLLQQYTGSEGNTGKHLQRIKNAVVAMKSILEDFLSLGKLEEGLIMVKEEKISAEEYCRFMQETVEEMEQMRKPGQQLVLECTVHQDITTDTNLVKNILINLLSNAIKFSPEGSAIRVRAVSNGSELELSVTDQGIGISTEDQRHLFQRFFRGRNAGNIQGTGLGLHIVGKYLELMKGKISLKSVMNEGTSFSVHLPLNGKP